jgi:superfamily II DNA helicase RecQ
MIRPPGDGKTLCYIVAGLISLEVTLVIQPTLTLSAGTPGKMWLLLYIL